MLLDGGDQRQHYAEWTFSVRPVALLAAMHAQAPRLVSLSAAGGRVPLDSLVRQAHAELSDRDAARNANSVLVAPPDAVAMSLELRAQRSRLRATQGYQGRSPWLVPLLDELDPAPRIPPAGTASGGPRMGDPDARALPAVGPLRRARPGREVQPAVRAPPRPAGMDAGV